MLEIVFGNVWKYEKRTTKKVKFIEFSTEKSPTDTVTKIILIIYIFFYYLDKKGRPICVLPVKKVCWCKA